nr:hypothetical protein [Tanacetum cinerariifolium]
MSGRQRSKGDDVQKISTSVFVTNFSDGYGANDLWNTCKLYGHVVDVFIPDRRTKAGKRFGFVRFIKVLDIDRLINNLCTVWMRRNKIHANVARFQREPLHKQSNNSNNKGTNNVNHGAKGKVKEFTSLTNLKVVLGKEGYTNIDLKYMGCFWVMVVFQDDETKKRFQFNLAVGSWFSQIIQAHNDFVIDEGLYGWRLRAFHVSGGLEIHLAVSHLDGTLLNGEELEEEGYHSNRICIRTKLKTVVFDSFKLVYRGMTCWVRAIEVPGWVPNFEEDGEEGYDVNDGPYEDDMYGGVSKNLKDVEGESDREEVHETNFEEVTDKSIFKGNSIRQNDVHFEDPFGIYEVLNKKRDGKNIDDKHEDSLKYPFGEKKMLWHYLSFVIGNWDGEVVIMEDFNEVRDITERFGSIFNKHGAEAFNSFIVNAGLVEVPLEVEKVDAMEVAQKAKIKWSIEGDENLKYYHEIPKGGNSSFITLITKVPNANMVKDFRPISLIGSLFKVITKVLANRLVTVLDDIVDEIQFAFLTDRQMLDGPFILSEIVHW